jgi:hypothetical protein
MRENHAKSCGFLKKTATARNGTVGQSVDPAGRQAVNDTVNVNFLKSRRGGFAPTMAAYMQESEIKKFDRGGFFEGKTAPDFPQNPVSRIGEPVLPFSHEHGTRR